MYLWLKRDAEKQLRVLEQQGLVGDLRVDTCSNSGKKYIDTNAKVSDPAAEIAEALDDLTEKVTAWDRIVHNFRAEGVYRHGGATLTAKTCTHFNNNPPEISQEVLISGPNVRTVKTIYSLFRQGKLAP